MGKTKKRVLITGIGGSIGTHVTSYLLEKTNWDIIGLDSFRHKGLTDRVPVHSRVSIFTHDLRSPISPLLATKIGQVDYIIHLASRSDVDNSLIEPEQFILDNVQLTTSILEFCVDKKTMKAKPWLKAFVQFSTDEVYGASGEKGAHKEWATILPSNPYSASKACQEAIAISYWRSFGVPLIITNTMNNFGEMQQAQKFPAMIQRKVTAGEVVIVHGTRRKIGSRYYLHSRNTADALLFILRKVKPPIHRQGEIDRPARYNIVGDKRVYNLELAQLIAKLLNKKLKYKFVDFHKTRPGHDRHYGLDGAKLRKLGWKSPRTFEASLKETIEWQKKHPEWLLT